MSNPLASSTSPYLRAHADNPVDWRPWGKDAFTEARDRDVPVLVSIGYSTCHWCHVMARESFSDAAVGELLRESVVAIKLDREELPAVDAFYMDALLAMRGQGGWPLNVFTTPDARPFFAGTYFPPEPRDGMPSFSQVVSTIARTWSQDRERAESIADQLASSLVRLPDLSMGLPADAPVPEIDDDTLTAAAENLLATEDRRWGGFGTSPKFPPTLSLIHLLRRHRRIHAPEASAGPQPSAPQTPQAQQAQQAQQAHRSAQAQPPVGPELAAVRRAFVGIASGGMRDQIDGGIARYSVDAQWHIPHFEKMLFDNAMYLRAAVTWHDAECERGPQSRFARLAAREVHDTARFLLERLELPGGGFASGLDADSVDDDGQRTEGAYYLEKADAVPAPFAPLGPVDAAAPNRPFAVGFPDVAEWVNGEPPDTPATGIEAEEASVVGAAKSGGEGDAAPWETSAAEAVRREIAARRAERSLPNRDAKLVTEWNGLAIIALEEAGSLFGEADWVTAAHRAFDAVMKSNWGGSGHGGGAAGNRGGAAGGATGVAAGHGDAAGGEAGRGGDAVRSSTDATAGPGAVGLADAAQMAVAARALGDGARFSEMLRDALGFIVFPQRESRVAGGIPGEGDGDLTGSSGAGGDEPGGTPGEYGDDLAGASGTAGVHRWDGASLLDAHGDGIVPARGSDPLDGSSPSGRSSLIEALRAAVDGHGNEGDFVDASGRPVSQEDLAELRSRLLASVLPALQQATRSLGWVLAQAESDAAR